MSQCYYYCHIRVQGFYSPLGFGVGTSTQKGTAEEKNKKPGHNIGDRNNIAACLEKNQLKMTYERD